MRSAARALTVVVALTAAAPISVPRQPGGRGVGSLELTALAFPTPSNGWVVASRAYGGAEVLGTRDGGGSWTVQWAGRLVAREIAATDPDHAWVLGQRCGAETCGSELIGTSDSGVRWSVLASLSPRVSQIAFETPSVGVAAARDASCRDTAISPPARCPGWVLATDDGGRSWRTVMKSAEPIVAVSARASRRWALAAVPGSYKPRLVTASLVAFASSDGGRVWTARGAVHPDMIAGLDLDAQLVPDPAGRLWLSALDPESCAMHGCGLDGAWSSADGGRRWRPLSLPDPFERGVGMPCGYTRPIISGRTLAASFNLQACAGPAAALYRFDGARGVVVHAWRSLVPVALAWPTPSIGYALGPQSLARSTDGGRRWREVSLGS